MFAPPPKNSFRRHCRGRNLTYPEIPFSHRISASLFCNVPKMISYLKKMWRVFFLRGGGKPCFAPPPPKPNFAPVASPWIRLWSCQGLPNLFSGRESLRPSPLPPHTMLLGGVRICPIGAAVKEKHIALSIHLEWSLWRETLIQSLCVQLAWPLSTVCRAWRCIDVIAGKADVKLCDGSGERAPFQDEAPRQMDHNWRLRSNGSRRLSFY